MSSINLEEWRSPTKSPQVLNQLRRIAEILRLTRAATSAGTIGASGKFSAADMQGIEKNRQAALKVIEAAVASGRLDEDLTAADYLYALNLLYKPASLFASDAEIETKRYLDMLAGGNLHDLTAVKGVNENGPDGIFAGGIPALKTERWTGLEVKTAVNTGSLSSNIGIMVKRMATQDYQTWRRKSHEAAIISLRLSGDSKLADELTRSGDRAFASLLVVRATGLDELRLPSIVREVFDLIIVFDLFGYPVWDQSLQKIPGWAFDELYAFAGSYNVEKAKASLEHYAKLL